MFEGSLFTSGDASYRRTEINRLTSIGDTFTPAMRLTLALLALVAGGYLLQLGTSAAALVFSTAVLLLWNYVRHSSVWSAFRAFQRRDIARVRMLLGYVRWPHLLSKPSLAYYHWLQGVVDAADGRLKAAQVHLLVAAAGDLRSPNDRCLVQCLLAEVLLQQGDREAAREHLRFAEALAEHDELKPLLRSLETRVKG